MPTIARRSSGLAGLAAVALIVAIVGISHRATRADELDWGLSNIEGALHKIESKLSASFSAPPPSVVPGVGFHLAKHTNAEYTGNHEAWHWTSPTGMSTGRAQLAGDGDAAHPLHRLPGHEWTDTDEKHYDSNMAEATGEAGTKPYDGIHLPPSFIPISDVAMQKQYAHNLVEVLRNLKSGYLEEMLKWAENGPTAENSYIAPIVEGIEAPLIKDLDVEAHQRVKKTVQDIGQRKNLNAHQMKEMRARLLVPLLLRIRARVHHQVELYTVQMLRRVILNAATPGRKGGDDHMSTMGIVAPSTGEAAQKPSDDEQMEYQLRDIDTLYAKGIISERDYQAEKAKVLSDWLGLAIKKIGGKKEARSALENFLWPPILTDQGCKCLVPFEYDVDQLGNATITYDECTDISQPPGAPPDSAGKGWCAIDPEDEKCMGGDFGYAPEDPKAHMGEDGYGWTKWGVCAKQPRKFLEGELPEPVPKVVTQKGCTCIFPFTLYPKELGGQAEVHTHCSNSMGEETDWCVVEGKCGYPGLPGLLSGDKRVGMTHWDKCVGEPAGFLALPYQPIPTVQGCQCKRAWPFVSQYVPKAIWYSGCTDINSPGTAWCAVEGDDCGDTSNDPKAGYGQGKYGWTKWDVCVPQPTNVMADLEMHVLPNPKPYVHTENGCQCQLPWKVSLPETGNKLETFYTCQRFGMHAAWCPTVGECGIKSDMPRANAGPDGYGWTHWDKCVGSPPGFLAPPKPKIYTRQGCVCKQPWPYNSLELNLKEYKFMGCTDIESPNDAWCAVDPVESPNCGIKSVDKRAGLGPGKYGWVNWDYCKEQTPSHKMGVVPSPAQEVRTLQGCTCKIPYEIKPKQLGGGEIKYSHCNRFNQDGPGLTEFYWCPVEEEDCGYEGQNGRWDKCVGVASGYLEPTPIKTVMGCDCILPFEYSPKVLVDGPNRFVYAVPTDIDQTIHGGKAWCATVGHCGRKSTDTNARYGSGGYGWTHWDVVLDEYQPPFRPMANPETTGKLQRELPAVVPKVRTQHGCICKLPWKYQPADTCGVTEDDESVCLEGGGYMMSGWCVTCKTLQYNECSRADQPSAWCAVEGECGTLSEDVNAISGAYGWTHWDNCIGSPAGYIPPPSAAERSKGATLAQKHGVTVESVEFKNGHKEVVGPPKNELTPEEIKELSIHKAIAAAIHKAKEGNRGREHKTKVTDMEIAKLAKQMRQSIKTLDSKIQKLDESTGTSLRWSNVLPLLASLLALATPLAL